jgi:phosphoribosyl-ATP pyrophosphohydrolase
MTNQIKNLEDLNLIIKEKISAKEKNSYTNQLFEKGLELIARKVGEEAVEVIVGAYENEKNNNEKSKKELIGEICDLFYHSLVLVNHQNISLEDLYEELNNRNNKIK